MHDETSTPRQRVGQKWNPNAPADQRFRLQGKKGSMVLVPREECLKDEPAVDADEFASMMLRMTAPPVTPMQPPDPPPAWSKKTATDNKMLVALGALEPRGDIYLTEWEIDFLITIDAASAMTPRQRQILTTLYNAYFGKR
jgi:hypothetical protein